MNDNSFSSLDRLMEFGMGIAVARQMIDTMNHTINNMQVPGAGAPIAPASQQYYALIDNQQCGPLTEEEVEKLVNVARINSNTLMWKTGTTAWVHANALPEVYKYFLLSNSSAL